MRQAGHFYKVIDEKTILVAQDTQQNRKEYEDQVVRTFFLSNGDVKDVSAMVRGLLDLRRMATVTQLNAIVIRDTADKVAVAERLIEVNDKAKAEVVLDVELLQLSTKKLLDLGVALSSYSITGSYGPTSEGGSGGSTSATLPWDELIKLSLSDFNFTVPSIIINFIKTNTQAEVLAQPQLRIAEGGEGPARHRQPRPIPVTTINTQQAIGQIGVVPGDVLPVPGRRHQARRRPTASTTTRRSRFKLDRGGLEPGTATSTAGTGRSSRSSAPGPITSNIRLKDGETELPSRACVETAKPTTTKTGIPFLADLPLVGPPFGADGGDRCRPQRTSSPDAHAPHHPRSADRGRKTSSRSGSARRTTSASRGST